MRTNTLIKIILLVLVVLTSFCVSPTPSNNMVPLPSSAGAKSVGVVIKKIGIYPQSVTPGGVATLVLLLKNAGPKDTTVNVELYGFDENELEIVSAKAAGITYKAGTTKITLPLRGADPTVNADGEERAITWEIRPIVNPPETFTITADLWVRVTYEYETVAIGKVELMSLDEFTRLQAEGKLPERKINVQNTASPLQVSLDGTQPLPVGSTLVVKINVRNVGSGLAKDNKAKVIISVPELNLKYVFPTDIFLRKGTSTDLTFSCKIPKSISVPRGEYTLVVKLEYTYYEDVKTSIEIEGSGESPESFPISGGQQNQPSTSQEKTEEFNMIRMSITDVDCQRKEDITGVVCICKYTIEAMSDPNLELYINYQSKTAHGTAAYELCTTNDNGVCTSTIEKRLYPDSTLVFLSTPSNNARYYSKCYEVYDTGTSCAFRYYGDVKYGSCVYSN